MKSGASRDRMSRLRPVVAGAAATIGLAGVAILAVTTHGVAHATPLLASAAATPTLDPLIVPTSAAATGSALSSTAVSTGSGGIELAVTLSCITTVAGLIIASITLTALIRTGYGPFLRALLPRWLRRKAPGPAEEPILRYQPGPNNPQTGFDIYTEAPSPRGRRPATRPAPRDDWSDGWGDPPPRQPRASQSGRGSSRGSSTRGERYRY